MSEMMESCVTDSVVTQKYTLNEWVSVWLNEILPGVVKPSTLSMYEDTMKRHILPELGGQTLEMLTASEVKKWLARLRVTAVPGTINETMTEGTVRNTLSVLSGCMRDAQRRGLIKENPCLEPSWTIPARNVNENRAWLNEDQIILLEPLLLRHQNKDGYPVGVAFLLVLYTGLLMSEAAALRWKDVDFSKKILTVRYMVMQTRSLNKEESRCYLEKAVGARNRNVPIPDGFCVQLAQIRGQFQKGGEDLVVDSSGEEPMRLDRLRSSLLRRGKSIGIERLTPQLLRDTYAMRAVQAGATSDVIAELMGFSSSQQVVRRYMPKRKTDRRELVNRMYSWKGI